MSGSGRPKSTFRRQISDVVQQIRQIPRCSAVDSPVDNDRQFKVDALWRSQTIENGKIVGDVTECHRPSCGVKNGLETME